MKSSSLSNLSGVGGYDFVVAVTQASINATMMTYLASTPQPVIEACYIGTIVPGKPGLTPTEIELVKLLELTEGVNPFTVKIPNTDLDKNPDFQKLLKARFMGGFRARMGIPEIPEKNKIADIVSLQGDTARVGFNLMCAEFTVVGLDNSYNVNSWVQESQSPQNPWIFSTHVDIRLAEVSQSEYTKLPPDVQKRIKNLGASAFSIQQLLFDLSNASLADSPKISGVEASSNAEIYLEKYFVRKYIAKLKDSGDPMLGCAVVPKETSTSTLVLTDLDFSVSPYLDETGKAATTDDLKQLNTLNYLCAAGHNSLPPPTRFPWNWVDESERADHHGCVSINRARLRDWLEGLVKATASYHCLQPTVYAKHHDGNITRLYPEVYFKDSQQPVVEHPDKNSVEEGKKWNTTGQTVLKFSFERFASDDDRAGEVQLRNKYYMKVHLVDSQIVIEQNIWVWYYARAGGYTNHDVVVNDTLTATYPLGISEDGALVIGTPSTTLQKNADPHGRNANISNINDVSEDIINDVKEPSAIELGTIPLAAAPSYIFPGGKTFLFKNARFSENQDLVAFITYADPVP